jgi:predicted aspartyl protease
MNTAGGIVNAQVYKFEQFQICCYRFKSIEIAVMYLDTMKNEDGLLVMNILKHFVFKIDQENNQLILNKN